MSKNKYHTLIHFHKPLIIKRISMIDNYYFRYLSYLDHQKRGIYHT